MGDNFECFWIEINRWFCKFMVVSVVYRLGYLNIKDFIKVLICFLDKIDLDKVEIIILGDFNVDYLVKRNFLCCRLDEFVFLFNLI